MIGATKHAVLGYPALWHSLACSGMASYCVIQFGMAHCVRCYVDKSHLAKSRPAPPDWQTFLNSFRFFLEIFNCPYCRTGWGSIVSWLRQPSSFPQLSASVENPPKVATHPSSPPKYCISHHQEFTGGKPLIKCQRRHLFFPSSTHIHVRLRDFGPNLFCYKL